MRAANFLVEEHILSLHAIVKVMAVKEQDELQKPFGLKLIYNFSLKESLKNIW